VRDDVLRHSTGRERRARWKSNIGRLRCGFGGGRASLDAEEAVARVERGREARSRGLGQEGHGARHLRREHGVSIVSGFGPTLAWLPEIFKR